MVQDQGAPKYAGNIIKFNRADYQPQQRILVACTTALYIIEQDTLKLHQRLEYKDITV